jgi:hypothetical protein
MTPPKVNNPTTMDLNGSEMMKSQRTQKNDYKNG